MLFLQGLPVMTLASFEEILFIISGLAMNGCLFVGELPAWLAETEIGNKVRLLCFLKSDLSSFLACERHHLLSNHSCSLLQGNGWTNCL